ncbi:MAG: response regulator, partial [Bryobacterales bacterium]|nr:response regulator [Bryobacterales bacterium]
MARLLVVEDDADQSELRRLLFERAGHEVEVAARARAAARACATRPPDVVVMDLHLPRAGDG